MKMITIKPIIIIIFLLLKPIIKVYLENNMEDDNLHPKYNKNVKRGKDGRFKSIRNK